MPALTPKEFIRFLSRDCADKMVTPSESMLASEREQNDHYAKIITMIDCWAADWGEEQRKSKTMWDSAIKAIETDIRAQFYSADRVIAHIHKIASKEPFLGNAKVSLRAIEGFTGDYLRNKEVSDCQKKLTEAPF